MHQGAEGSESAMVLEGVICGHVQRVLTTGLSQTLCLLSLCQGGSGSALNDRASLGVNFSLVNVNAPEPCRKVVSTAIPLGAPSSSGRVISQFSSCRLSQWFVCMFSPHMQATSSPGELPLEFANVCVALENFLASRAINEGVLVACLAFVGA